jgi:hypothetical protein
LDEASDQTLKSIFEDKDLKCSKKSIFEDKDLKCSKKFSFNTSDDANSLLNTFEQSLLKFEKKKNVFIPITEEIKIQKQKLK